MCCGVWVQPARRSRRGVLVRPAPAPAGTRRTCAEVGVACARRHRARTRASSAARPPRSPNFPFQVALYDPRLGGPAKGFFCGGVILDATRVATAAHCLIGERGQPSAPSEIEVLAGSSDLEPPDPRSVARPGRRRDDRLRRTTPRAATTTWGCCSSRRPLWSGAAPALDGHSAIAPLRPEPGARAELALERVFQRSGAVARRRSAAGGT